MSAVPKPWSQHDGAYRLPLDDFGWSLKVKYSLYVWSRTHGDSTVRLNSAVLETLAGDIELPLTSFDDGYQHEIEQYIADEFWSSGECE